MPDRQDSENKAQQLVPKIASIVRDLDEAVSLMYNALVYGRRVFLDEAYGVIEGTFTAMTLIDSLLSNGNEASTARPGYPSMLSSLRSIGDSLSVIARSLDAKIKEDVLLSDKAMSEMNYLFQRTREMLSTSVDLILAPNVYVANYIGEATLELERTAETFVSLHEDRLIGGLCLPKASGIFITCVDSFKHIAWQIRAIAGKMAG